MTEEFNLDVIMARLERLQEKYSIVQTADGNDEIALYIPAMLEALEWQIDWHIADSKAVRQGSQALQSLADMHKRNAERLQNLHNEHMSERQEFLKRIRSMLDLVIPEGMTHNEKNGAITLICRLIEHEIRSDDIPF